MTDLSDHAKALFEEFITKVGEDLITVIDSNIKRFPSSNKLIKRYRDAISRVRKGGYCQFKENAYCLSSENVIPEVFTQA